MVSELNSRALREGSTEAVERLSAGFLTRAGCGLLAGVNAEEGVWICIRPSLRSLSAVACSLPCAGEQGNCDFPIVGKKQLKRGGQTGRKQVGMTLVLRKSFPINFSSSEHEPVLKCIKGL